MVSFIHSIIYLLLRYLNNESTGWLTSLLYVFVVTLLSQSVLFDIQVNC